MGHHPTARGTRGGPNGESRVGVLADVGVQSRVPAADPVHVEPELRAGPRGRRESCRGQPVMK